VGEGYNAVPSDVFVWAGVDDYQLPEAGVRLKYVEEQSIEGVGKLFLSSKRTRLVNLRGATRTPRVVSKKASGMTAVPELAPSGSTI
jgi:hypothetical protein